MNTSLPRTSRDRTMANFSDGRGSIPIIKTSAKA